MLCNSAAHRFEAQVHFPKKHFLMFYICLIFLKAGGLTGNQKNYGREGDLLFVGSD